jgi:hypothetical protein
MLTYCNGYIQLRIGILAKLRTNFHPRQSFLGYEYKYLFLNIAVFGVRTCVTNRDPK